MELYVTLDNFTTLSLSSLRAARALTLSSHTPPFSFEETGSSSWQRAGPSSALLFVRLILFLSLSIALKIGIDT